MCPENVFSVFEVQYQTLLNTITKYRTQKHNRKYTRSATSEAPSNIPYWSFSDLDLTDLNYFLRLMFQNVILVYVGFEVFEVATIKNVVFWGLKTKFVLHRRHITSRLQSAAS
jgi:hypothetical protein